MKKSDLRKLVREVVEESLAESVTDKLYSDVMELIDDDMSLSDILKISNERGWDDVLVKQAIEMYIDGYVDGAPDRGKEAHRANALSFDKDRLNEVSGGKITPSERRKIGSQIYKFPVLGGNIKVSKPSEALAFLHRALHAVGFELDMVTGDILLGDKGSRLLPFSRTPVNPSDDGESIENSRISFTWEVTSVSPTNSLDKKFEVTVYVT